MSYQPGVYAGLSEQEIARRVAEAGFDPIRIADPPGYVYPPHTHAETKLLAILRGDMQVEVEGQRLHARAGDQLIIPGSRVHAAVMGPAGCVYFWSERIMP